MRVKYLEIQGFKSFKDRTIIRFDQPITGIVGPNGCGKSNIVDAFFWVMGDQSNKHMRASGSDELIFNGGAKYQALGMAEATLVLETGLEPDLKNAASGASVKDVPPMLRGKEVSVTRRVYSSGEGEYFINGIPSRLKDIQELFMDTGIGTKGYSVIKQGEIDRVVNAKPDDRRVLIEEAAGIAKYKARKKESLRKLEVAETNLSRIRDVLAEMERTLSSLERQSQKARKYKEYRDELHEKETGWARKRFRVLSRELTSLEEKRASSEEEMQSFRTRAQTLENESEAFRVVLVTLQSKADSLLAKIQETQSSKVREESALEISRSRQKDLEARLQSMKTEREDLENWIASEKETLGTKETRAKEEETRFKDARTKKESQETVLQSVRSESHRLRSLVSDAHSKMVESISKTSKIQSEISAFDGRIESSQARLTRAKQAEHDSESRKELLASDESRFEASVKEAKDRRDQTSKELGNRKVELRALSDSIVTIENQRNESRKALHKIESRLESLRESIDAREWMGEGPKKAFEWAKAHGKESSFRLLSDEISVEPGFEQAAQAALEFEMEALVSTDSHDALESVHALTASREGRVAFYLEDESFHQPPATPSSGSEILEAARSAGISVRGLLSHFIRFRDQNGSAVRLKEGFDSYVVVDRMEEVLVSRASPALSGVSWVSMDGVTLDPHGTLRGGLAGDPKASILHRKNVLASLEKEKDEAQASFDQHEMEASNARKKQSAIEQEIESLESRLRNLQDEVGKTERDWMDSRSALGLLSHGLTLAKTEQSHAQEEIEQSTRAKKEAQENLNRELEIEQALQSSLDQWKTELTAIDSDLHENEKKWKELQNEESHLRESYSSLQHEWELSKSRIEERAKRVHEIQATLESVAREKEAQLSGDGHLEHRIRELVGSVKETEQELSSVRDEMERISQTIRTHSEEIKALQKQGEDKLGQVNECLIRKAGLEADLQNLKQNIEEKYGQGILEAAPVIGSESSQVEMDDPIVTEEISKEEELVLREEVESLHDRIRRLGDVNPAALEEFEEHQKRTLALDHERLDLEKSIENLKEAIDHINLTSEDRFAKAFQAIDERFRRLFPIIFGGGEASLSLVYPEGSNDILDAGVEIMASPPGKKVQNISLLSGGEKALTALALVFGIFMVKPSPFCLLDEVDAPLDDSNVGKFNALLREMSSRTQFILITHNKKTMELNDSLYGVTMEEPGVSKMVSIRMSG